MELTLKQLSEHTWLLPHNPDENAVQSSIGVITTQNESLLIEAGNSPRLARQIKTELYRNNLPPVSQIIYTHHHWDHIYGACEFDVPVTAHTICKVLLEGESQKPWGIEYLRQEIQREPKLIVSFNARAKSIEDWGAFRIVVPEEVFEREKLINLGQLAIELEHVGGEHAQDSIFVKIPQDGVMFIGDCYYPPPLHLRKPNSAPSLDMLRRLQNDTYKLYVEEHDEPFARTELIEFLQKKD
ncbi:MAG: MBL fold metallo-hydrolase [Anaerolineales bacterium]|jgi:glyoxylase-like metal-dependent hydrolase (beta-lactamase superfamily II)